MRTPKLLQKISLSDAAESCDVWQNLVLFCGLGSGINKLDTRTSHVTNMASDPYTIVRIEPSGKYFAASSAAYNRPVVQICEMSTGKVVASLTGHQQEITDLLYHPDGSLLAVDSEGTFIKWKPYPDKRIAIQKKFDSALRGSVTGGSPGSVAITLDESLVFLLQAGSKVVAKFNKSSWVLNNTAYIKKNNLFVSLNNLPKKRSLLTVSEKDFQLKEYPMDEAALTKLFAFDNLLLATASDGFLYSATPPQFKFMRLFNCGVEPLSVAHKQNSSIIHVVGGNYERGFLVSLSL